MDDGCRLAVSDSCGFNTGNKAKKKIFLWDLSLVHVMSCGKRQL